MIRVIRMSFLKIEKDLGSLKIHKILFSQAKPSISKVDVYKLIKIGTTSICSF